jgi:hypothetical protein
MQEKNTGADKSAPYINSNPLLKSLAAYTILLAI